MTQTSAFHFESLVWDWPIAIYLFFDWYFCRSGDAGRAVTSLLPSGRRCRQYVAAHHADCRAWRGDPRSVDPRLPPDKTVDLLEADVPLQFYLGDVDGGGVMLFQLYMVVLVLWLAKIFEHDLLALQQRWLPKLGIVQKVLSLLTPVHRGLETLMLVLAVLLGGLYRLSAVGAEIVSVPQ